MDIIVSVDENWGIGNNGQLLTKISADLKRFRKMTNCPKAVIMLLTASVPKCPLLKIILVVAIFKDNLKRVMIKSKVGKAEKSVGFLTYKAIKIIKAESAIEVARKKSNNPLGKGTMIIAKIAIIKHTTVKSFEPVK